MMTAPIKKNLMNNVNFKFVFLVYDSIKMKNYWIVDSNVITLIFFVFLLVDSALNFSDYGKIEFIVSIGIS